MIHKELFKCYTSVLPFILACLSVGCLCARFPKVHGNTISTKVVIEVLIEFVVLSTVMVSILGASFCNVRPWEYLITQYIRITTTTSSISVDHVFMVRHARAVSFIGNVYFIFLWTIVFFYWKKDTGLWFRIISLATYWNITLFW